MFDTNQPVEHCWINPGMKTWAYNIYIRSLIKSPGYRLCNEHPNFANLVCENLSASTKAFLHVCRKDIAVQHIVHAHYYARHLIRYLSSDSEASYITNIGGFQFELPPTSYRVGAYQSDSSYIMEPLIWMAVLFDDAEILKGVKNRFVSKLVAQGSEQRPGDIQWLSQILATMGYSPDDRDFDFFREQELSSIQRQGASKIVQYYLSEVRWPLTKLFDSIRSGVDREQFEQGVYRALVGYNRYWLKVIRAGSDESSGYFLEGRGGIFFGLCAAVRLAFRLYDYRLSFGHPSIPDCLCYNDWPQLDLGAFKELPSHPDDLPNPYDLGDT